MFCSTRNIITTVGFIRKTATSFQWFNDFDFSFASSLIVHVCEFRSDIQPIDESVWQSVSQILPNLRVAVHMINAHETFRKYSRVLRPSMPLSHLR